MSISNDDAAEIVARFKSRVFKEHLGTIGDDVIYLADAERIVWEQTEGQEINALRRDGLESRQHSR